MSSNSGFSGESHSLVHVSPHHPSSGKPRRVFLPSPCLPTSKVDKMFVLVGGLDLGDDPHSSGSSLSLHKMKVIY